MKMFKFLWAFFAFLAGIAGQAAIVINPSIQPVLGVSYPVISAQTKSGITSASTNGEEVLWERQVVTAAAQTSPFADNMVGPLGSGKPIVVHNDTSKVAGTSIVIPTVDQYGNRGVQGNGVRVGMENKIKPGDFKLYVDLWWTGDGLENTAAAQTIIGEQYDALSQKMLANRLQKKQSDDAMMALRGAATSLNTIYPSGKTLDTLSSSDTYSTDLVVSASGRMKDIGALPINVRKNGASAAGIPLPPVKRYLQFLTDAGARPIKTESAYLEGVRLAAERGDNNNLFSGEYSVWDNNVIYPWENVQHGGYGSIGSALQPEALLGTAIPAKGTSTTITSVTGGGVNVAQTDVDWFEFFSLFSYLPINGQAVTLGTGTRYFAIKNATDGKIAFFSFTGNTGTTLTGITRLGSTATGNYATTVGDVTWNSGAWTTAADGLGYQGLTEGALAQGSLIVETNSKGVPLCYGFGLGEMALVCGYGRIALASGGFKTMANKTSYVAPHGQARSNGIEVSWGCGAFKRPDGLTPNFVVYGFARNIQGFPVIS